MGSVSGEELKGKKSQWDQWKAKNASATDKEKAKRWREIFPMWPIIDGDNIDAQGENYFKKYSSPIDVINTERFTNANTKFPVVSDKAKLPELTFARFLGALVNNPVFYADWSQGSHEKLEISNASIYSPNLGTLNGCSFSSCVFDVIDNNRDNTLDLSEVSNTSFTNCKFPASKISSNLTACKLQGVRFYNLTLTANHDGGQPGDCSNWRDVEIGFLSADKDVDGKVLLSILDHANVKQISGEAFIKIAEAKLKALWNEYSENTSKFRQAFRKWFIDNLGKVPEEGLQSVLDEIKVWKPSDCDNIDKSNPKHRFFLKISEKGWFSRQESEEGQGILFLLSSKIRGLEKRPRLLTSVMRRLHPSFAETISSYRPDYIYLKPEYLQSFNDDSAKRLSDYVTIQLQDRELYESSKDDGSIITIRRTAAQVSQHTAERLEQVNFNKFIIDIRNNPVLFQALKTFINEMDVLELMAFMQVATKGCEGSSEFNKCNNQLNLLGFKVLSFFNPDTLTKGQLGELETILQPYGGFEHNEVRGNILSKITSIDEKHFVIGKLLQFIARNGLSQSFRDYWRQEKGTAVEAEDGKGSNIKLTFFAIDVDQWGIVSTNEAMCCKDDLAQTLIASFENQRKSQRVPDKRAANPSSFLGNLFQDAFASSSQPVAGPP
ncbi:hypothetical protein [Facilibium subflavum]|uniref:hypothetical protein n=1 Tax=Facilibium subflavum TaxID=2219058 RepID=UPI000E6548CF|nr:hypothetical protein [Facilibium subflavum]